MTKRTRLVSIALLVALGTATLATLAAQAHDPVDRIRDGQPPCAPHDTPRPGPLLEHHDNMTRRAAHCAGHAVDMKVCQATEDPEACRERMRAHHDEHFMRRCMASHTQEECEEKRAQLERCRNMTPEERAESDCPRHHRHRG